MESANINQTYCGFGIHGEETTSSVFNVDISNVNMIGDGTNHKDKDLQPSFTGIYWFGGQGNLWLNKVSISKFFNGLLTTGDCITNCTGERYLSLNEVNINNIFGVGFGLFGRYNVMNVYSSILKNVGTAAIDTLLNSEYGQGGYFHRNSTTLFHGTRFENVKSAAITYFSSGTSNTAKYQIISNCYFKDSPNGVSSDDRFHNTMITGCYFDNAGILVGASAEISNCIFTSRTESAIGFSSATSPDKPMTVSINNCKFYNQISYAINVIANLTQTPTVSIAGCLFVNESSQGNSIQVANSCTVYIQNCLFQGSTNKNIFGDNSSRIICNDSVFGSTAGDQNIKITSTSKFYGNNNYFENLKLSNNGTGEGELYNSKFFNTPTITNTNANFKVISKVYTLGQTAVQYP